MTQEVTARQNAKRVDTTIQQITSEMTTGQNQMMDAMTVRPQRRYKGK